MNDLVVSLPQVGIRKHKRPDPFSIQITARSKNCVSKQFLHFGPNLRGLQEGVPNAVRPDRLRAQIAENTDRVTLAAPNGPGKADRGRMDRHPLSAKVRPGFSNPHVHLDRNRERDGRPHHARQQFLD